MNRRSVPAWLLAASLALNAGIVVAVALHQWQPPPQAQATQPSPVNLPDYLEPVSYTHLTLPTIYPV